MSENKWREFWISCPMDSCGTWAYSAPENRSEYYMKAVEFSALEQANERIAELEAENAALKRAKSENDERFMIERDEARAETAASESRCQKYREALDKIAKDFGTDYCDGNTMIAREALSREEG